jgi:hypothetical protein
VVAHELAHGAFNLFHTFGSEKFVSGQGTTDNLLDYKGGTELWKYQWKFIHDPQNLWLKFLQDEEDGEMYTINDVTALLDTIRYANSKAKQSLVTNEIVRYQDIVDDANLADSAGVLGITKEEFLSSFTHEQTLQMVDSLRNILVVDTMANLPADKDPVILANKVEVTIGDKTYKLTINGYAMTTKIYTTHIAEDIVGNEHKLIFFNADRVESKDKPTYIKKTDLTAIKNIRKAFDIIVHAESDYGTVDDLKKYIKIKGSFDFSGSPTISDHGLTLHLKRKYSNSKITVGELTVDGDESVKLITVELKKGTENEAKKKCDFDRKNCPECKDSICFRINKGIYTFELNTQTISEAPQHRYKSLRLHTKGTSSGGNRDGVLVHAGWNYGFTEGCILTMTHNSLEDLIANPQNYIKDSTKIKNVDWNNSATMAMSLYEYVEKNVPDGSNKGKIIITEDDEIVDVPENKNIIDDKKEKDNEKTIKEKSFFGTALDILSEIIIYLILN